MVVVTKRKFLQVQRALFHSRFGFRQVNSWIAISIAVAMFTNPMLGHAQRMESPTEHPNEHDEKAEQANLQQAEDANAQREYELGSQAYTLGNYEKAVEHFERSYALSKRPELVFNIGQAYSRLYSISADVKHLRKAKVLFQNYRKFLENLHELDGAKAQSDVDARIAEIDQQIAEHESAAQTTPEGPVIKAEDTLPQNSPVSDRSTTKADKPVYKRGWFWGTIVGGLVIVGGVTAAVLLTRNRGSGIEDPELGIIGAGPGNSGFAIRF